MAGVGTYLREYQLNAIKHMKIGCILCGGVGSGKSRTALAYYYACQGGSLYSRNYVKMRNPRDLYIITTARKRDTAEWEQELIFLLMNQYDCKVVIDSWNNIKKYKDVKGAFFIFDEQRVVGSGTWVKSFEKIAWWGNHWILLSATPGDNWLDYIPVFVANGFYKNRTEFMREHVVRNGYVKFFKVDRYLNTRRLERLRDSILVTMDFERPTIPHHENVWVDFDRVTYRMLCRTRWNPWENAPIENASGFCQCLRKLVNTDSSREAAVLEILEKHPKCIIFYNYDYELEILLNLGKNVYPSLEVAEWNGHKHQPIPDGDRWIYLVQYTAGAEGWNCIKTDTIIFYSQNYSYKVMVQASGRIDRMNTPYTDLYFYHLKSRSGIDLAIAKALKDKKKFNETRFYAK
jgi:hypothetical protein